MSPPLRSVTDRDRLASCALSIRPVIGLRLGGSGGAALGDFCSVERGVLRLHGLLPTHDLGRLVQGPVAEVEGVDIVFEWPRPDPPAWKDDPWEVGGIGAVDERGRTRWPEGARYCYRHGGHELTLFVRGVTDRLTEAVAGVEARFALVTEGALLVLGYRFGEAIPWAATAPFHWLWLPPEEGVVPPEVELTPETFARHWGTLWITPVEADGGLIRARRAVALSPPFTCALLEALRRQATQPFLSYAGMHALARLSQAPEGLPRRAASLTRSAAVLPPRTDSPSSLVLPSTPMDPQVSGDSRAMEGAHASARHASSRIIIVPVGRWSSLPDLGTRRTGTVPVGPETG